ncbi:hypothetical protein CH263_06500 [Rhodococcus sp. 06-1059B-a]|nr:hypothetical protein CH263_06500 [Rhodococcus sp. 06-1059B-a]
MRVVWSVQLLILFALERAVTARVFGNWPRGFFVQFPRVWKMQRRFETPSTVRLHQDLKRPNSAIPRAACQPSEIRRTLWQTWTRCQTQKVCA